MNTKYKILVIDDSDIDRKMIAAALQKKNFEVVSLHSGINCLEVAKKEKPDVVLLDNMMPEISGIEVLKVLRSHFSPIELPILMITAKTATEDIIEALSIGADDYIVKPVNFEIALMRINTRLKIVQLSKEMGRLKEMEAVNSMIATYNHEINNPLMIAMSSIGKPEDYKDKKSYERLKNSLDRISEIVKKISSTMKDGTIQYENYTHLSKIINLKNK